jgi:hypothetical protein
MKYINQFSILMLLMILSSCQIVGGIFKAGMGFGIFLVIAVLVFIVWLITRARK